MTDIMSSPTPAMGGSSWNFEPLQRMGDMMGFASSHSLQLQLFGNLGAVKQDISYFDAGISMNTSPTECLAADLSQNFHIDKT